MASRPPPRLVVRHHDEPDLRLRRRLWLGLAWLASLLLVAGITFVLSRPDGMPRIHATPDTTPQLHARIDELEQQVVNLQRAAQVSEVATRSLQSTLTQREKELDSLRSDLGFYSRLVGGDSQRQGLKLQEVKLKPIPGSRGWNLNLSLTQNARRGDEASGTVRVSVEGLRGDKVVKLDWPTLGETSQKDGIPFRFTYFQQLHATFVLPEDFRPTRLRIDVQPSGAKALSHAIGWSAALSGNITTAQGEKDAHP